MQDNALLRSLARSMPSISIRPALGSRTPKIMLIVRCLPRAIGPEQTHDLTGRDVKANAPHGPDVAERLFEALDLKDAGDGRNHAASYQVTWRARQAAVEYSIRSARSAKPHGCPLPPAEP